ncbi:class F sortase [Cutibacterium equinum]|uniref:Class F sortase n=1 Tax=Cutibacterium equinum TaxID=3016342 RepID=A0ABY7R178_9ACTN|nr:class F sortase [Cutibacterium equinum]WCC81038.1 class F sortase [Cutibacterium equinum]
MVVVALIIAGIAAIFVQRNKDDESAAGGAASSSTASSNVPAATTSAADSAAAATPQKKGPVPAGCMTNPKPIMPTKYSIDGMKVSAKVMALGVDSTGAAATPPKSDPSSWAWFNEGPMPGSNKGKVALNGHTYHKGGAIGNRLLADLKTGDIIRISDKAGQTVCYRFDHKTKIMVKNYDPNSNVLYDDNGPAQIVIVVCDDYRGKDDWASRVLFYANPVA